MSAQCKRLTLESKKQDLWKVNAAEFRPKWSDATVWQFQWVVGALLFEHCCLSMFERHFKAKRRCSPQGWCDPWLNQSAEKCCKFSCRQRVGGSPLSLVRKDQQQWVATQKGHDFVSFRPIFTFKIPTSTVLGSRNRFLQSKVRSSEWFKN